MQPLTEMLMNNVERLGSKFDCSRGTKQKLQWLKPNTCNRITTEPSVKVVVK